MLMGKWDEIAEETADCSAIAEGSAGCKNEIAEGSADCKDEIAKGIADREDD